MAFLRLPFAPELPPPLAGGKVVLKVPDMADYQAWADVRLRSRAFLVPWEPAWSANDLSRTAFRARIKRYLRDVAGDLTYPFFIFRAADNRLVGAITLSNVRRGVAQTGALGYWVGVPYARQGLMTAAVRALLPFAFQTLHLHRIEAACLPANIASIALLRRCGFAEEGYAKAYLKIAGRWQDHLLFARLDGDAGP